MRNIFSHCAYRALREQSGGISNEKETSFMGLDSYNGCNTRRMHGFGIRQSFRLTQRQRRHQPLPDRRRRGYEPFTYRRRRRYEPFAHWRCRRKRNNLTYDVAFTLSERQLNKAPCNKGCTDGTVHPATYYWGVLGRIILTMICRNTIVYIEILFGHRPI